MKPATRLRKTPLHALHRKLGAKMAEFGGWEMPIEYSGIIPEHLAVRTAVGLFDISHMGRIGIEGPQSLDLVQKVSSNDAARLKDGQIQYSALLYPEGTFVDDILVHRLAPDRYFLCVNASNSETDLEWIRRHNEFQATVTNSSDDYAQLALQGPRSVQVLQPLVDVDLSQIQYYWLQMGHLQGMKCLITRTGYTGEDGFEIYFAPEQAERIWNLLSASGSKYKLIPVGLGARNTLRLEAKMALYGHEISDKITPWEADLAWIGKLAKGNFIGKEALVAQQARGVPRRLVGFEMMGRGIGRDGYPVWVNDQQVGFVTSGAPSPFLKKNIGLAYVPVRHAVVGTELQVEVRSQRIPARIVETPFYSRNKQ
jgi:aminomethyltransferase